MRKARTGPVEDDVEREEAGAKRADEATPIRAVRRLVKPIISLEPPQVGKVTYCREE